MARLEQLHRGKPSHPAIVFIHGLGGDLFDTWIGPGTSSDNFWLAWIGRDTDCDTWTLGYDAAFSHWRDQAMPLPDQGTEVAQLLAVHPGLRDRGLVLVGHSMGGLVIKTLITQSQASGDAKSRELVRRILGVVFIATPHQGSELASLASALSLISRVNMQVGNMCLHDPHFSQLGMAFREQRKVLNLKVAVFVEARDVLLERKSWWRIFRPHYGVRVVNQSSSDPGLEGVNPVPLSEDHFSICKPSSPDAHIHHAIVAFVRDDILAHQPEPQVPNAERKLGEQPVLHTDSLARGQAGSDGITGSGSDPALGVDTSAFALFDVYTLACRNYYIPRPIDSEVSSIIAVRSPWLIGRSGVGKTSIVRRYIDLHEIHPLEISLSQLGSDASQQSITREIVEAVSAATGVAARGFDLIHAVEAILSLPAVGGVPLFLDEVPIGTMPDQGSVGATIGLLLDAVKRHMGTTCRFLVCSLNDPLAGNPNGKFREGFFVKEVPGWTSEQLREILTVAQDQCGISYTPDQMTSIVEAAAGSPRFVKTLMRNSLLRQPSMEVPDLIKLTSTELRGL